MPRKSRSSDSEDVYVDNDHSSSRQKSKRARSRVRRDASDSEELYQSSDSGEEVRKTPARRRTSGSVATNPTPSPPASKSRSKAGVIKSAVKEESVEQNIKESHTFATPLPRRTASVFDDGDMETPLAMRLKKKATDMNISLETLDALTPSKDLKLETPRTEKRARSESKAPSEGKSRSESKARVKAIPSTELQPPPIEGMLPVYLPSRQTKYQIWELPDNKVKLDTESGIVGKIAQYQDSIRIDLQGELFDLESVDTLSQFIVTVRNDAVVLESINPDVYKLTHSNEFVWQSMEGMSNEDFQDEMIPLNVWDDEEPPSKKSRSSKTSDKKEPKPKAKKTK